MANPEHLAVLKAGVETWNRWRTKNAEIRPDLSDAYLEWANLREADLREAALRKTNLRGADLSSADLGDADLSLAVVSDADLKSANLRGAYLSTAKFDGAILNDADLVGTDLFAVILDRADLRGADLRTAALCNSSLYRADLTGVIIGSTSFVGLDLSCALGLETIKHHSPSSIGIDTIYKSKGRIPHSFLRGAGVPENFIQYMPSLVGSGIEFYSLFISYSTKDQEFAERLHSDLQAKGVRCWFAPHEMLGGKKVMRQIDEAIRMYDKLLLILSPASMESEWVRTEIALARKRENEQKKEVLFPIALCPFKKIKEWEYFDSDIGKDSAREIREYHIPNFAKWKMDHDAYQEEFSKLLKALQGNAASIGA